MFQIDWAGGALNDLAQDWLAAPSDLRRKITQAIAELERKLQRDPLGCGESRDKGLRIEFAAPVALTYHTNERLKVVTIAQVRIYRLRAR